MSRPCNLLSTNQRLEFWFSSFGRTTQASGIEKVIGHVSRFLDMGVMDMTGAILKCLGVCLTLSIEGVSCRFPIGKPDYFYRAKSSLALQLSVAWQLIGQKRDGAYEPYCISHSSLEILRSIIE